MPDPARGVFETLLVRDGRIQALDLHLARLTDSTTALYALAPSETLAGDARTRAAPLIGAHRLRIDAVPSGEQLAVSFTTSPIDPGRPRAYACTPLMLAGGQGPHKYVDRRAIESPGGGVPLIVDGDGTVLEAAWANVWLLDGDTLATPPADGRLLPGVTRTRLLAVASRLGVTASERPITEREARAAPVLMLTSSVALAVTAALQATPPRPDPRVETIRAALESDGWDDPPPSC